MKTTIPKRVKNVNTDGMIEGIPTEKDTMEVKTGETLLKEEMKKGRIVTRVRRLAPAKLTNEQRKDKKYDVSVFSNDVDYYVVHDSDVMENNKYLMVKEGNSVTFVLDDQKGYVICGYKKGHPGENVTFNEFDVRKTIDKRRNL